jgi:hypothetical protein
MPTAETIDHVDVKVTTGEDDKECGVFSVRLFQGGHEFLELEYGDGEDWDQGHDLIETEDISGPVVNGKPLKCEVALEERPGQVNITWDSKVRIELKTSADRSITWQRKIRFDTDHRKPEHRRNLGFKHFH